MTIVLYMHSIYDYCKSYRMDRPLCDALPIVVGFPVSSHRECWLHGWVGTCDMPKTDLSTAAVLGDKTRRVIRWLPEAPLESLRLDTILLSSQLQVRIISTPPPPPPHLLTYLTLFTGLFCGDFCPLMRTHLALSVFLRKGCQWHIVNRPFS